MILRTVAVVIISCTVLFAGCTLFTRLFGVVPYAVMTGSMEPALPVGALVYVNTNNKAPDINDVIAFNMANGVVVTHRVIAVQDGKFITKGDANNTEDLAPVSEPQIIGTCMFHIPFIGYMFLIPTVKYLWVTVTLAAILYLFFSRKVGTHP